MVQLLVSFISGYFSGFFVFRFLVLCFQLGKLESMREVLIELIGVFCFIVFKWFRRIKNR